MKKNKPFVEREVASYNIKEQLISGTVLGLGLVLAVVTIAIILSIV